MTAPISSMSELGVGDCSGGEEDPFSDLPVEMIHRVTGYLPLKKRLEFRCLSRTWDTRILNQFLDDMELGWTVKALAIILKIGKSFPSGATADLLITHKNLLRIMPLIQKACPVELESLFFSLKTPTTKEWRVLLTLVTNHLYETHSLQTTLSSLGPQQQLQCLRLYLRLYGKDLTRNFEESMFDTCLEKPDNSMVHIIYYLIYQGLLSEECASRTVSEIYEYMEELEEGTLLSILYSLLFYLSQEVSKLPKEVSKEQSEKLSTQIANLLTQLQRKYPRVVGCIALFVNEQCKTIQLPDSLSSLSEEDRAQIKQDALCTILDDCDGLDGSGKRELFRQLEGEAQYPAICEFLKQKDLSPENRTKTLVKLFEPKGSIVLPLEVRRPIITLVCALMDTLFCVLHEDYEEGALQIANDFVTQYSRQFVQIFKLIDKMRVEGTTVDHKFESLGAFRCSKAIRSALSVDKWEGYVEELISRRCYDHVGFQLVFRILLSVWVPTQRCHKIVGRNWNLAVYLSALSPGVKSTQDGRLAFSRIIDVIFKLKHGTSYSEKCNWLRNLCNKQVACEGEQNALQEQVDHYLKDTMQRLGGMLHIDKRGGVVVNLIGGDWFQKNLDRCLLCVDCFSLGSVRYIQVLDTALQGVYKIKKQAQQHYEAALATNNDDRFAIHTVSSIIGHCISLWQTIGKKLYEGCSSRSFSDCEQSTVRDVVNRYMENTRALACWAMDMDQDDRVQNVFAMAEETFFFAASFPSEDDRPFLNTLSQWANQRLARLRNELWETTTKDKVAELTLFQARVAEKIKDCRGVGENLKEESQEAPP